MDCTKCGLPIEGGQHGANAIVVKYHWSDVFFESERATDVRHAVCVDDPLALPNVRNHLQFRKWGLAMIRDITAAASQQVHDHNDLVDALEKFHPGTRAAYQRILLRGSDHSSHP